MKRGEVHDRVPRLPLMTTAQLGDDLAEASAVPTGWTVHGRVLHADAEGSFVLRKAHDSGPGSELGIATEQAYEEVELRLETSIEEDACFIAKVHQEKPLDQLTNSYHLFCHPRQTYLGMHNRVLRRVGVGRGRWERLLLRRTRDLVEVEIGGRLVARVRDATLGRGYCFLGLKGGNVRIRSLAIKDLQDMPAGSSRTVSADVLPEYDVLHGVERHNAPTVSIITTVYDRVSCLRECIRTVQRLRYRSFEHIIVLRSSASTDPCRHSEPVGRTRR